ncbi:MAG: hypothetical protein VCG02_05985 [Verrucomicrobiota bacterium]|jgi:hypothetical protein
MTERANRKKDEVEAKLRRAWKKERRFIHLRGLSRLLVWATTLVLVDLLVDWQILFRSRIAGPEMLLLLALNLGVLGWVLWREWLRYLKPYNPEMMALEVEGQHPELASLLISYMQIQGSSPGTTASPALLEAMRNQAVVTTTPMDFREIIDFRQLRNLFIVAACTVLVFSAISFNWPHHMHSLFLRMMGIEAAYPTRTQIVSVPGNLTVKQGETIKFRVKASGKLPESGKLLLRSETERAWQVLPLAREGGDAYVRHMPECYEALVYRVRIGDARSETYTISVSPPPEITFAKIQLRYPDYMREDGVPDPVVSELNLEVPVDTQVNWELRCQPPISALQVKMGGNLVDARIDEAGTTATFGTTATNSFKYTFTWTERENGFTYGDVLHMVRVVPDRIPGIELMEPSGDRLATVNKTVQVGARATDDRGLAEATLVYSLNGEKEERIKIQDLNGSSEDIAYAWVLAETLPDLKDEDVLRFHVEVSDKRPPRGSHINISSVRKLSIVTDEAYLDWFRKELNAQREKILRARKSEKQASEAVRRLGAEEKKEQRPDER